MKDYRIPVENMLDPLLAQGCRVFSVVGSGGKTTLIRRAALYYADYFNVGVAASTKMCLPDDQWRYRGIIPPVVSPDCPRNAEEAVPPVCFYTEHILPEGKIWDIGEDMLKLSLKKSDMLLVEADGSNCKPLKGWRKDEPVIVPKTDVTIGILPIHCLNQTIDSSLVHRMEAFTDITGLETGDRMTEEAYVRLITHPNGLFGHGMGERILVFNRADNDELKEASRQIAVRSRDCFDRWIAGCLENE